MSISKNTEDDLLEFSQVVAGIQDIIESDPETDISFDMLAEATGITVDRISHWFCITNNENKENQILPTAYGFEMMPLLAMLDIN